VYRGSIPDPGVNAIEVVPLSRSALVLSQSISNENTVHYPSRGRQLRLKCIDWMDEISFKTHHVGASCLETILAPESAPPSSR
jgi:hypothetical protein